MNHPTPNIPALLAATCDLESGHPVEAVLRAHGIPNNIGAYDVVKRYKMALAFAQHPTMLQLKKKWASEADRFRPCVLAISEALGIDSTTAAAPLD